VSPMAETVHASMPRLKTDRKAAPDSDMLPLVRTDGFAETTA